MSDTTDWTAIKNEYISSNQSYRELAEKHKVSFSKIQKIGAKEKWTDARKKVCRKAEEKLIQSAANKEAKKGERIVSVAHRLLNKIEAGIDDGTLIVEARDIRAVTSALKDIKEITGYKSELDLKEQEARIDKLRKEATIEERDSEIRVILDDALREYTV